MYAKVRFFDGSSWLTENYLKGKRIKVQAVLPQGHSVEP